MMYHHGTLRWQPSPSVIYQTAKTDLLAYQAGNRIKAARQRAKTEGAKASHQGKVPKTVFLPNHVQGAGKSSDVIRAAIKGLRDADKVKKVDTLLIYQDESALRKALAIAESKGD